MVLDSYYIAPKYLSIYRLLYGLIVVVFTGLPAYTWLSKSPDYLFVPPAISFANFFNGFPGYLFFYALTFFNLAVFFLMIGGIWCRWTSILFALTSIAGQNFWFSFGKIDHFLLWIIAPIFLCLAGWGNHFALRSLHYNSKRMHAPEKPESRIALWILLFALSIAFSMFTSGFFKITGGWLNYSREATHYHLVKNYFTYNRSKLLAPFFLNIKNHLFWKSIDYVTVAFEIVFFISVFKKSVFRYCIAIAVVFHLLVLLLFNIFFYSNLIAYLLFINWELAEDKLRLFTGFNTIKGRQNIIKSIYSVLFLFLIYWIVLFFTSDSFFRFPGLIESICNYANISDKYDVALYGLFITAAILLLMLSTFKYPARAIISTAGEQEK